jgi:creatinine amidohydrolase/Fe(II)-dependent formamide hydrolase-like protein
VVTNGHGGPRHASALEAACRKVSRKRGIHMFTPSIAALHRIVSGQRFAEVEELIARPLAPRERAGLLAGEHAGTWETSFMLVQQPELIEREWRELGPDAPPVFKPLQRLSEWAVSVAESLGRDAGKVREIFKGLAGGIGWLLNTHYGYGGHTVSYQGDPSVASPEIGQAFREVMVRECLGYVERVTSGDMPATAVRSIASDPALIQPYFLWKVGIAALVIGAWALW